MIDNISSRILVMCNLTNDCNQKCTHCISNARAGERIELNLETVERFISYMQQKKYDFMVSFVGGEATIWPDFYKLLESKIFKSVQYKMLYTNATALNDSKIRKIKDANFYEVRMSIDSDRKEEHDDLRGIGMFDKTLLYTKKMIEIGIPVTAATVLKQNNKDRIDEIITYVKSIGVKLLHIIPLYMTGRGASAKDYVVNQKEIEKIRLDLKHKYADACEIRTPLCIEGTSYIKIECDGCCYIQKGRDKRFIGNINDRDFKKICYNLESNIHNLSVISCQMCPYYTDPILCENMYPYCLTDISLNKID